MVARLQHLRRLALGKARADRDAAAQTSPNRAHPARLPDSGNGTTSRSARLPSGPRPDQERAVLVAQIPCGLDELGADGHYAAFALDRLQNDRRRLVAHDLLESGDVVDLNVDKAGDQGLERPLILPLAGGAQHAQGSTVERPVEGHDLVVAFGPLGVAVLLRNLERGLIGGCAADAVEHLLHPAELAQPLGKLGLGSREAEVGDMDHVAGLGG